MAFAVFCRKNVGFDFVKDERVDFFLGHFCIVAKVELAFFAYAAVCNHAFANDHFPVVKAVVFENLFEASFDFFKR